MSAQQTALPILFIQTAFVGDLLLSIPTLKALRKENPSARITLLCRKGLGDFMKRSEVVDEVVEADKTSKESFRQVERKLRAHEWSTIYCPHQSLRSLFLVKSLKSQRKIGYRSWLGKLVFDEAIGRPMHLPEALRQLVLLSSWRTSEVYDFEPHANQNIYRRMPKSEYKSAVESKGKAVVGFKDKAISKSKNKNELILTEKLKAVPEWSSMELSNLKSPKTSTVVLAPGSVWATKKWVEEGFIEVAAFYLLQGKRVQLVGAPDEKEVCERVRRAALSKVSAKVEESKGSSQPVEERVINSAGKLTLWQSAQLMASSELVITNDSGAMHMAACAGTPSVSIFGPTVLEQGYRPWQTHARVVHTTVSCRPCGKHGAQKCPIGTHECMKLIDSSFVVEAAKELLK